MAEYSYSTTSGAIPTYKHPKLEWDRIQALTQEQMAPGVSEYRRGLRNIRAGTYPNPMEQAEAYRGAMEGYGEGLGQLQAGASRAATGLYGLEYGGLEKQAQADWQTAMDMWKRKQLEKEQGPQYGPTKFMPEVGGGLKQLGTVYSPGYNRPLPSTKGLTSGGGPVDYWGNPLSDTTQEIKRGSLSGSFSSPGWSLESNPNAPIMSKDWNTNY